MHWKLEEMIDETLDRGAYSLEDYYGDLELASDDTLESQAVLADKGADLARSAGMEELAKEWDDYLGDIEAEEGVRADRVDMEETYMSLAAPHNFL